MSDQLTRNRRRKLRTRRAWRKLRDSIRLKAKMAKAYERRIAA